MEVFSSLKFWRNPSDGSDDVNVSNPGLEVDENTSNLVVTGPQTEFDKVSTKNKSSIFSTRSVGVTSFDNDTNNQHFDKIFSKRDGQAKSSDFNRNVFSVQKLLPLETNFKSQSPILVLRSSPKNCVSMLGFKKSSSSDKPDSNSMSSSTVTPKIKESKKCMEEVENTEDSSSRKCLKVIKLLSVQALKIRIFDESVSENSRVHGEKQQGSRPAVFREVCRSLMKSKSSVKTVSTPEKRRDDSALQQQDGIQSAILYCKRSYSSSSSSLSTISQEYTVLSRSASECSDENEAINPQMISK
ncbi:hypothetical protein POM88_045665 [Heracleum sosnowskyi]|uniref:Membrane-associated kinase regulator 5 n=1 Tax=Heracleum sosnowskyi TaxID=360622 RepID=A0AAD8H6C2_9APIA|nr:hypothetical protein POM88_045665 [Heracleum sosnowskyi]